jgi:hypothetical protein
VAEAAEAAKSAKVQRGIREMTREMMREILRTIGKRTISGSAFIASGKGIPPKTA